MLKTFPVQRLLVWRFHGRVFDPMGPASPAPRRSRDHDSGQRGGDPHQVAAIPYPPNSVIADVNLHLWGPLLPSTPRPAVVGPGGENAIVMSRCRRWLRRLQLDLVLDDEADEPLLDETELVNGSSYQPFNYSAGDPFPAPH